MREHILVGVDGSEDGLRAVHYGAHEAMVRGLDLRIIHAVDDAVMAGAWGVIYDPSILTQVGEAAIATAAEHCLQQGMEKDRIITEVVLGNPAAVLTRLSHDAALSIVGRRAISGLERIFVGSTSVALAAAAKCPVVMISAATNPDDTDKHRHIGIGVDTSPTSGAGLRWALTEAAARQAKLSVIHVVPGPPPALFFVHKPTPEEKTDMVAAGRSAVERLLAPYQREFCDVEVDIDTSYGVPVDVLVQRSSSLDLLILGARGVGLPGLTIGGVVRAVMAHAECPVGVIRTWAGDKFGID